MRAVITYCLTEKKARKKTTAKTSCLNSKAFMIKLQQKVIIETVHDRTNALSE